MGFGIATVASQHSTTSWFAGDRSAVLGAMAGAAVVDADKPCEYFFGFNPFPMSVRRLHAAIQRESPRRLPHEIAVAVGLLAVVLWTRRGPGL